MNHGFIGFGNIAKAIYAGLKKDSHLNFAYFARSKRDSDAIFIDNIKELIEYSDIIWLTIKPQDLEDILKQVAPIDRKDKVFVSPIAGKKIELIEQYLGKEQPIVRIMPNLAIAYQKSVTSFTTNHPNNPKTQSIFEAISKLGKAIKLEEDKFDLFTSIFGSGPAFILAFIQSFKTKTEELNLPISQIEELLLELAQGTTEYFSQNKEQYSIEELIENITSKGGTTEAGLNYFHKHEISKQVDGILESASERSKEMGEGNNS